MLSAPPLRPVTAPVLCPLEPVALIVVSEFIQTFCNTGQFTTSRVILGAVKLDQYGFHVRTLVCQRSLWTCLWLELITLTCLKLQFAREVCLSVCLWLQLLHVVCLSSAAQVRILYSLNQLNVNSIGYSSHGPVTLDRVLASLRRHITTVRSNTSFY